MQPIVRSVTAKFENSESRRVKGLASVFYRSNDPGTQYELGKNHYERIDPKAFDRSLKDGHVVFLLLNHQDDKVLARSGVNLNLRTTSEGLEFSAELNSTSWADDALALVREGQIGGASFKYFPTKIDSTKEGNNRIDIVRDGILSEVSMVYQPAYEATEVMVRSIQEKESNLAEYEKRLADLYIQTKSPKCDVTAQERKD